MELLKAVPVTSFEGTVYRRSLAPFQNSMLSMAGSMARGGRYNIRDYFGCLYACFEQETLQAEMARYFTVAPDCGFADAVISVRLSRVVDLTSEFLLKRLGLSTEQLLEDSYTLTQHVGQCAWSVGLEALIVPSAAASRRCNLAILLDNQRAGWALGLDSVTALPPAFGPA